MTLVRAGVRIEDDDAVVEVAVGDEQLVGLRVHEQAGRPAQVLGVVAALVLSRVADLHEELARARELQDLVVFLRAAAQPHVVLVVHEDAVLGGGPLVALTGAAPGLQELAVRSEFQNGRRRNAALRLRGIQRRGLFAVGNASPGDGRPRRCRANRRRRRRPAPVTHLFGSVCDHSGSGSNSGTCWRLVCARPDASAKRHDAPNVADRASPAPDVHIVVFIRRSFAVRQPVFLRQPPGNHGSRAPSQSYCRARARRARDDGRDRARPQLSKNPFVFGRPLLEPRDRCRVAVNRSMDERLTDIGKRARRRARSSHATQSRLLFICSENVKSGAAERLTITDGHGIGFPNDNSSRFRIGERIEAAPRKTPSQMIRLTREFLTCAPVSAIVSIAAAKTRMASSARDAAPGSARHMSAHTSRPGAQV